MPEPVRFRHRWLAASMLCLAAAEALGAPQSPEEAFEEAVRLIEARRHEDAIPLLEIALDAYPDSPGALWNLGTSALITERYDLAASVWSRYREVEPGDWQGLAKLVQAHQGTGNHERRDSARAELLALRESGTNASLSQEHRYCREQYPLASGRVFVYEYFHPFSTERAKFYEFFVTDAEGDTRFTVSFGSYESTNSIDRELGDQGPGERLYHFDAYYPDGRHTTLSFVRLTEVMTYDAAREVMAPMAADLSQAALRGGR